MDKHPFCTARFVRIALIYFYVSEVTMDITYSGFPLYLPQRFDGFMMLGLRVELAAHHPLRRSFLDKIKIVLRPVAEYTSIPIQDSILRLGVCTALNDNVAPEHSCKDQA